MRPARRISLSLIGFSLTLLLTSCGGGRGTAPSIEKAQPLTITSSPPPSGSVGVPYGGSNGFPMTAAGGTAPYKWSWAAATGSYLPAGLNVSTNADSTGKIAGTPTAAGSYNVIILVEDSEKPAVQTNVNYTIVVPLLPQQPNYNFWHTAERNRRNTLRATAHMPRETLW